MLYQCRAEKHEDRTRGEVPAQGFVEDDETGEHREHRNQECHGRGCGRAGVANDAVLQYIGQPGAATPRTSTAARVVGETVGTRGDIARQITVSWTVAQAN